MDEKERQSAFLAALTTEHFVLQTASSATVSESSARGSIYLMSLSSGLVAIGFAAQSREAFGPLVASVIPALFLLGLFTVIRLVDVGGNHMQYLARIARIRGYYRGLTAEAADYFAPEAGRLSESPRVPSLQLGSGIAFLTTTSTMVAFVDNIVGGGGVALLVRSLLGVQHGLLAVVCGLATAIALSVAFLAYQKWRFGMFEASRTSNP